MADKTTKRKAAYKAFCRDQVVTKGLINHPDGNWHSARADKAMDRDMRAGYRAENKGRRKRRSKQESE